MKRFYFVLFYISFFSFLSCDESVSNKADFKEDYVLYSIINCDTTFHTAYVSKSYNVDGLDPSVNTIDPTVKNAVVSISYASGNYLFKDTSVERINNTRCSDNLNFYTLNNLDIKSREMHDYQKPITIYASLPNSKTLTGNAFTIPSGDLYFDKYPSLFSAADNPKVSEFGWKFIFSTNLLSNYYFLPSLEIDYSKVANGVSTRRKYAIPYKKIFSGNQELPVFPGVIHAPYISFLNQDIKDAFAELSQGDSDKGSYTIHNLTFKIIIMDKNTASYWSSGRTFEDEFSVRIEAAEVSNINGGYGVFGLYAGRTKKIKVDADYVLPFGYKYEEK